MPVSPGIYVREFDFSAYVQQLAYTHLAIVGAASKGPVGVPTKVTSASDLVNVFGKPLLTEFGLLSAIEYLKEGTQLTFVRVANAAQAASYPIPGTVGATAAVKATGTVVFVASANPADGDTITIGDGTNSTTFEFDNNAAFTAGNVAVLIGATALDTLANLMAAVATSGLLVDVANTTVTVPQLTLTQRTGGVAGNVAITKTGTDIAVTGFTGGTAAVAGSTATVMTVHAKSPGTWANGIKVVIKTPSVMFGAPTANFDMDVYVPVQDGVDPQLVERYLNLSLDKTSPRYVTAALLHGIRGEVGASTYIEADVAATAATISGSASGVTYVLGTSPGLTGTDGVDGLTANHYIGTVVGQKATGLQALRNPETTEFNLLAIPGNSHRAVIAAMLDMCKKRGDAMALIDAPYGLDVAGVIEWHNGLSVLTDAPTGPLDSSYGALFWSWCEVNDSYSGKAVEVPPSGCIAAMLAYGDRAGGPWLAHAGLKRGKVNCNRIEYSPDFDDREKLQGDPNRVNPLIIKAGGIYNNGNRTLQRALTALNNIHTRRMMLFIEKACATAIAYLQFDPNDPATWQEYTTIVTKEISPVVTARGIGNFRVTCDENTNPPEQRRRKIMRGKIEVEAVEAAEIVYADFALYATGAEFNYTF